MDSKGDKIIVSGQSLSDYFYRHLSDVNKKSNCPLPQEFILYSSEVMQEFAFAGRAEENVLGVEFLKAEQKSIGEKKVIYKEIGDSILFQLGMFPDGITKKSPSKSYYINLGKSAYSKAAALDCSFYDIPNFYNLLATSLENLIMVLTHVSGKFNYDSLEQYLLNNPEALKDFGSKKNAS